MVTVRKVLISIQFAVMILCCMSVYGVSADKDFASYNPVNALDTERGIWEFWSVNKDLSEILSVSSFNGGVVVPAVNAAGTAQVSGRKGEIIRWTAKEKQEGIIFVRPNENKMGIRFKPEHPGNYKYSLSIRNISINNNYAGDGGWALLGMWDEDSYWNVSCFEKVKIPVSAADVMTVGTNGNIAFRQGQSLMLWLHPGGDGNGDGFEIKYTIEETDEKGIERQYNGLEGLLVQSPQKASFEPAPYRENLLWIGSAPNGSDKKRLQEVYDLWEKYFPGRVAVVSAGGLNDFGDFAFFAKHNVPVLYQYSVGKDLDKYLDYNAALEVAWDETTENNGQTQHGGAIPHKAFTHAFEQAIEAGMNAGASGYGHSDYIWNWWLGRGRSGYNPQTIEAFRRALKGEDEGLRITYDGGAAQTIHFWDYAKHYLGRELTPEEQGFASWDEYKPLTEAEYQLDPKKDYTPRYMLFDLLVHYEWLLGAQRFGSVSTDQWDRITQILPNNEDMANGNDMLYLGGLENVTMVTEELFNNSNFLDRSYYTLPSLMRNVGDGKSVGVVLEGGVGGNAHTYFDNEIAYAVAYELTAAGWSTHMELDWWHGQFSWQTLIENERYREHLQTLMSFGRGYMDSLEDSTKSLQPEFVNINSRSMVRPWGADYDLSDAKLRRESSDPSIVMSKKGFVFRTIGEDMVYEYLDKPQKIITYSPDRPMRYHFDGVLDKIGKGFVENAVIPAQSMRSIVDSDLHLKDMAEVYPEFSGTPETVGLSGSLTGSDGKVFAENISVETELYTMNDARWKPLFSVGGRPVVAESDYGAGKIWMVLFNPRSPENYELSGIVYSYLLQQNGIKNHWYTVESTGEYTGNNTLLKGGYYENFGALESEASVRLYKNDSGLTVAGVQNPKGRFYAENPQRQGGKNIPYAFDGVTTVKVLTDAANTRYDYVAMPSGVRGSGTSDADGFLELSFENTTHEIFYILPSDADDVTKLSKILGRTQVLDDAISLDGRIPGEDTTKPVTTPVVQGSKAADGSYGGKAVLELNAADNALGSGIKKIEYRINDGRTVTVVNRGALRETFSHKVSLPKGECTIRFKAEDKAGNKEQEGVITVFN